MESIYTTAKSSALPSFPTEGGELFFLAQQHLAGGQGTQNEDLAACLFKKAADMGYLPALEKLHEMYLAGLGIEANTTHALKLLTQTAKNCAAANYRLGVVYFEGKVVEQNRDKAITFFKVAARQNHPEAAYTLGKIYADCIQSNTGFFNSLFSFYKTEAIYYFTTANQTNHPDAAFQLAELEIKSDTPEGYKLACEYYEMAVKNHDHEEAKNKLKLREQKASELFNEAELLWNKPSFSFTSKSTALHKYKLAYALGHGKAALRVGKEYESQFNTENLESKDSISKKRKLKNLALECYDFAANKGIAEAAFFAANMLEEGRSQFVRGLECDSLIGIYYQRAAKLGHHIACIHVQSNLLHKEFAKSNSAQSAYNLALFFLNSKAPFFDEAAAIKHFEIAANSATEDNVVKSAAAFMLYQITLSRRVANPAKAKKYLAMAADAGHEEALKIRDEQLALANATIATKTNLLSIEMQAIHDFKKTAPKESTNFKHANSENLFGS